MKAKTNKQRNLIIDRGCAMMLLRLFDACYQMGLTDAAICRDEGLCRAHVEITAEPGVFGRVNDDTSTDWLYWQITLERVIYGKGFSEAFLRYARNVGRYGRNYLSVAYVCALDWYRLGLTDYCATHNADLTSLNGRPKMRLRKDGTLHEMGNKAMVSETQLMCFKRSKTDREAVNNKYSLKEFHYAAFTRAIGLASVSRWDIMS